MSLSWPEQLAIVAIASAAVMVVLFLIQLRTRDAGIVDVGWAGSLGAAALFIAITGEGDPIRRGIIGAMGAIWGFRLAFHLLIDRVLAGPEDGRYQMMREKLGRRTNPVLFVFFLAQALFVVLLSPPFLIASASERPAPAWSDVVGASIWLIGLIGETVADRQLRAFKRDPAARGRVCTRGLWRYSRHPNYFFEWLMWIGYAAVAATGPAGWLAWSAPLLMLILVLKVTGIPPTEARALKSRGEAYRQYQQTTSAFIPWFPRSRPVESAA